MADHVARTISVYDQIAEDYNAKINAYAPRPEREKFVKLLTPQASILDAGCGPGRDSEYFASKGFAVTGVDLSEKFLEIAKRKVPPATFLKQDLRKLDFQPESFDGIWACASLLHLKRTEVPPVLASFYRLLKHNGCLFVMVKEGSGEAEVEDTLSPQLKRHFTFFSVHALRKLLLDANFMVDDIYTWNTDARKQKRNHVVWISGFSRKN